MSMTQPTESAPVAAAPQVHTYTAGTLVYEVNLSVPREKADDYIDWLSAFTKDQVKRIPGFLSTMVFRQPKPYGLHWLSEEGNAKTYITVHYVVESQAHLEEYLKRDQPAIATAEQERFEFLVTSRRTLSVVC